MITESSSDEMIMAILNEQFEELKSFEKELIAFLKA